VLSKPMPTLNRTRYAATARMSRLRQCPSPLRKRQADWNRSDVFVIGWLRRRDWRQDPHASAPLRDLLKGSGVTSENVLASAKEQIARSKGRLR
jgi:hypothetical protein